MVGKVAKALNFSERGRCHFRHLEWFGSHVRWWQWQVLVPTCTRGRCSTEMPWIPLGTSWLGSFRVKMGAVQQRPTLQELTAPRSPRKLRTDASSDSADPDKGFLWGWGGRQGRLGVAAGWESLHRPREGEHMGRLRQGGGKELASLGHWDVCKIDHCW